MEESLGEFIIRKGNERKKLPTNPNLQHSNSDTNLVILKLNEKKDQILKNDNYLFFFNEKKKNHEKCSSCNICHHIKKMIRKDKRRLSDYIVNNEKYVKLFGNSRYNNKPPSLFVKDEKKKLDQKKVGLIPLPLKSKKKIKSKEDHKQLYDLQRSIVMMRRFQYNQHVKGGTLKDYTQKRIDISDIIRIQRWWKKILKVIKIQKNFRGYYMRKEICAVKKLFDLMNKFESFLLRLYLKKSFFRILNTRIIKKKEFKNNDKSNICYISKKHISNVSNKLVLIQNKISSYILIKKLKKDLNNSSKNKIINKIYLNQNQFITKKIINFQNEIKKIKLIQNFYIKRFNYLKENIPFSSNIFYSNSIKNYNFISSECYISKIIKIKNEKQIIFIQNKIRDYLNKQKIKLYNIIKLPKIQILNLNNINLTNENELILDKKLMSKNNINQNSLLNTSFKIILPESNYISKIYKKKITIIQKQINFYSYFTKNIYRVIPSIPNLGFINLLNLYITKKTQESIFYRLKYNIFIPVHSSFYVQTLQRNLKFYLSNPKKGKKIINLLEKVFPDLQNNQKNITINKILSNLNPSQQKILQNSNIYSSIEQDFIDYLCLFSKYDKKLSNEHFIRERLKHSNLINTNIFSLTKFIDDEYDNLVNGKYCLKCYQKKENCHCTKKSTDDDDDYIDMDFPSDEFSSKAIVNHFEYDSTKCKGILIKRKPKMEEAYEDPITNMIIDNGKKLKENPIITNKIESLNNSYNSSNNSLKIDKTYKTSVQTNKSIAELKALYHNDTQKNKSNQVLIRDSNYEDSEGSLKNDKSKIFY